MPRLAHLSDIHITTDQLDWRLGDWFNKRLAAWINFRWLGRHKLFRQADEVMARLTEELSQRRVDHVAFSGDATALGFESEFRKAAQLLGVGGRPGIAIPGNHDYCTIPAARSGHFEKHFAPWLEGERIGDSIYPFAQRFGPAWLVALNTATGNRWFWDAGGSAGAEQRERLAQLLKKLDPGPRILVTHFPVCRKCGRKETIGRGLRDLEATIDVAARGGVSLWLHGHRHGFYHAEKPPQAPFPIICAGSATQKHCMSYGEYEIEGARMHGVRRVYSPEKGRFEDVEEFSLPLS